MSGKVESDIRLALMVRGLPLPPAPVLLHHRLQRVQQRLEVRHELIQTETCKKERED